MATLVLSAAGMALGGSVGGSVLGLSMAAAGRAAGAVLGRRIDQSLLGQGSAPVEHGRIDRLRLTGASEGAPLQRVYGRMRVAGQVIWASQFHETMRESGGGKGAPAGPKRRDYSYSVSLAVGLCAGEITRVDRVWADGVELRRDQYTMRVYSGTQDQQPDPKIEAVEGAGRVPAYPGLAYVVFEDLDVTQFGNRVPQFSFELHRPAAPGPIEQADIARLLRGVALVPGTGEYALATEPVALSSGFAEARIVNMNTGAGETDFQVSARALDEELPGCGGVSLVVSWFGDDLRCGACRIRPKIEQNTRDAEAMPWQVAGISRAEAALVPRRDGAPVYGGTPCDASVKQAIRHLRQMGKKVTFYPFILMEQMPGNGLPDPWSDSADQPVLPWRGRITTSQAPGRPGSPDGTAQARAEVDAFFDDPEGKRRFILHYARLCRDAGGVDAFCIGSEMRGLTFIRDDQGYPAVDRMIALAAEVRAILGPDCEISYAADWSEYHGHQPGNGDKIFHLDPLWANQNIDFIGIDNYMPLSDWREGEEHLDAHWGDVWNLDYLRGNVAGGEMFDWYYATPEARAAQIRSPITDGHGEPWVWRQKDLRGWWENFHHNRIGGARASAPTPWRPGMKPIRFTEYGCAALDKATNQPNKFLDPKSSESQLPRYSNGMRDDFLQLQYFRAVHGHYADPLANPVHPETGQRMVELDKSFAWAWDARPWPAFPGRADLWDDAANYARGHWLNGRASARGLDNVVREICACSGVVDVETRALAGVLRGYAHEDTQTGRQALQPLMLAYGFDAIEREGRLIFRSRSGRVDHDLSEVDLALDENGASAPEIQRAAEAEISGRVRLAYIEADGAYETRSSEAILPDDAASSIAAEELPLVLGSGEAQGIAERWLAEARLARDTIRFALPPSRSNVHVGDTLRLAGRIWRLDRVEETGLQRLCEAVAVEPALYSRGQGADLAALLPAPQTAPVTALFLDLPLMQGDELPAAPHVALTGRPWTGMAQLLAAARPDADYHLLEEFSAPAFVGLTETPLLAVRPGLWDRGPALRVRMVQGDLQSIDPAALLGGGNLAAIGDGAAEAWELFQFAEARLVAPRVYELNLRLRGQAGTDGAMPDIWPVGSKLVILNSAVRQIWQPPRLRGVARDYRWGPVSRPPSDATWGQGRFAFRGVGLRPYPVCHLRWQKSGNAHHFKWIRRTRIDGDDWQGFEVPLGEERELYNLRVILGGVLRREFQVQTPEWSFDAAARAELGLNGGYQVQVQQISERFGPGPAVEIAAG